MDAIVLDDIVKLWQVDLEDHTIGAVIDPGETVTCAWGGIPNYKELGSTRYKIFNAGVMVIDITNGEVRT